MIQLSSSNLELLGDGHGCNPQIRRLADSRESPLTVRPNEFLVVRSGFPIPSGFCGYLFFEKPNGRVPPNAFYVEPSLSYLTSGDVVRVNPARKSLRVMYRKCSPNNALLLTERCNSYCLMCSQPPKVVDDSYLVNDALETIGLMSPETGEVCLTGGEPTLLGPDLIRIIEFAKSRLPSTAIHILSNGRTFKNLDLAKSIADTRHHDLMIGIPVYSDISSLHDHVVQAYGAFDETIKGIINLKSVGVRVEIRVVLHKLTYERLPDLARFIRRNLTFCDQVILMGLELTGFTKFNFERLWIDPKDYQPQLKEAVGLLAQSKMRVSIYNHQLCVLDPSLHPYSRKSISDWKNEYIEECETCARRADCGGFFSSGTLRHSAHIKAFR